MTKQIILLHWAIAERRSAIADLVGWVEARNPTAWVTLRYPILRLPNHPYSSP
ncbi:hypothetical protein HC928_18360 [bacterium]|nr:hypothetical protein [bacterium]